MTREMVRGIRNREKEEENSERVEREVGRLVGMSQKAYETAT